MDLENLQDAALNLSKADRLRLLQGLILSLDSPSPEELRTEWLDEAERRMRQLDSGAVKAIPGEDVLERARALVR
ncbi:addiction module protein [Chromatocurvus halotolerans]|uniref:Putative addiction module component (TIGR02574 family) n=1 Tax=Chromatocurvus halotolerans TaxID=1132028 RepID=A0A4R2KLQ4_9GAMM|nr:addiction module protein [Chromatocurvus halotolerans]TCO74344.1 putative addiction module component (TIGR02574 family) [Chromatocurvus halotolerans]